MNFNKDKNLKTFLSGFINSFLDDAINSIDRFDKHLINNKDILRDNHYELLNNNRELLLGKSNKDKPILVLDKVDINNNKKRYYISENTRNYNNIYNLDNNILNNNNLNNNQNNIIRHYISQNNNKNTKRYTNNYKNYIYLNNNIKGHKKNIYVNNNRDIYKRNYKNNSNFIYLN
jgi:hypothetical protein